MKKLLHICAKISLYTSVQGEPLWPSCLQFFSVNVGLSCASYVFSKLFRPLVNKWRGEGKMVNMFLHDGFACAQGYEKFESTGQNIKNDILKSGFVPDATKCF